MRSILNSAVAFLALSVGVKAHPGGHGSKSDGKALYFTTNDDPNSVVAVPIGDNGKLYKGTVTPTGGKGLVSISGSTNESAVGDGLLSQSAITISGNYLFAVNAGSNTLSMFSISKHDPTKLRVMGEPVAIPGEFPNTVAALGRGSLVCVATTGSVAGVSCANFGDSGLGQMDDLRTFDIGQSTPPVGPTNTVSQVFFSQDGTKLYATVKGDPTVNNFGFFSAFSVEPSCNGAKLSKTDVRSTPKGTAVLFGSVPIPGSSDVFVTDASFGGAVLSVDKQGAASTLANQTIEGQMATCWSAISGFTKTAFVTDVAVPHLVEMSLSDASIISEIDLRDTGVRGLIDLEAAGKYIYALAPGDGKTAANILVVHASKGKVVQKFSLSKLGAGANSQGMAILF